MRDYIIGLALGAVEGWFMHAVALEMGWLL